MLACLMPPNGFYNLNRVRTLITYVQVSKIITLPIYNRINVFYNTVTNIPVPANVNINYTSKDVLNLLNKLVEANNDTASYSYALDLFIATNFCFLLKPNILGRTTPNVLNSGIFVSDSLATYGKLIIFRDNTKNMWLRPISQALNLQDTVDPILTTSIFDDKDFYSTCATRSVCNWTSYNVTLDSFGLTIGLMLDAAEAFTSQTANNNAAAAMLTTIFNNVYNTTTYSYSVLDYKMRIAAYIMFGFCNSITLHATISRDLALAYEMYSGRYSLFNYVKTSNLNERAKESLYRYTPITFPYLVIWREFHVIPTSLYAPIAGIKTDYVGKEGGYYNIISNQKIDYLFNRANSYNESYITTVQAPDGKVQYTLVEWENNVNGLWTYMSKGSYPKNTVSFTTRTKDTDANYVPIESYIVKTTMYGPIYAVAHQACSINYAANAIDCVAYRIHPTTYSAIKKYDWISKQPLVTLDQFSLKLHLYPSNEKMLKTYDPYYAIEADIINYVNHNITNTYNPTISYTENAHEDLYDLDFEDYFDTNKDVGKKDTKIDNIDEADEKLEQDNRNNKDNKVSALSDINIDAKIDKVSNPNVRAPEQDIEKAREDLHMVTNAINQHQALLNPKDIHDFVQNQIDISRTSKVLDQSKANVPMVEKKSDTSSHKQSTTIGNNLGLNTGTRKPPMHAKEKQNFISSN